MQDWFENQFLSGGIALMVFGAALASLRQVPRLLWGGTLRAFTVTLEIRDRDIVELFGQWIAGNSTLPRRLSVVFDRFVGNRFSAGGCGVLAPIDSAGVPNLALIPGFGWYLLKTPAGKVVVTKAVAGDKGEGQRYEVHTMTLTMFGRSAEKMRAVVAQVQQMLTDIIMSGQLTYVNDSYGNWNRSSYRSIRPLASIVMPDDTTERLSEDVEQFLARRKWYEDRGIPYRRGYLFHGVPGSGKSSMVQGLCGRFRLPLYALTPHGITDEMLLRLVSQVSERSALLIEDADCFSAATDNDPKDKLSMSSLLNAIDGPVATEGRVLFITTNHIERLTPALLRSGRVDVNVNFKNATPEQAATLHRRFYPEAASEAREFAKLADGSRSMADLQERLLSGERATETGRQAA